MHVIAAKAVAFKEALSENFIDYQKQVIKNAKALAEQIANDENAALIAAEREAARQEWLAELEIARIEEEEARLAAEDVARLAAEVEAEAARLAAEVESARLAAEEAARKAE